MPSRRDALATLGAAATLSLSGCLGVNYAPSPYCQLKGVVVTWTHRNQRHSSTIARAVGYPGTGDGEGVIRVRIAEELPSVGSGPRALVVDDALATTLERTFESVTYVLGFCGDAFDGCRNADAASRAAFNRVQVGDEARVTNADQAFHVHSVDAVDAEAVADWRSTRSTFDFSDWHGDDGAPTIETGEQD